MLKKITKIFCILTIFVISNRNVISEEVYEIKTNRVLNSNNEEEYLQINDYKLLIKSGDEENILNKNLVYKLLNSQENNILLAGHNNNVVFNRIYRLKKGDEILLYSNSVKHIYTVMERRCIKVNDVSIYNNETNTKKLVLITCTNDNQKRFIVDAVEKKGA